MTEIRYLFSDETLVGFCISGHSTASAEDDLGRLVCASISSAAYMTANTVTEIIGADAEISVDEEKGHMYLRVNTRIKEALPILEGFRLHTKQLATQFTKHISINSEV